MLEQITRAIKQGAVFDNGFSELNHGQIHALVAMNRHGKPITMSELASVLHISAPSATALADKLVKGKFVQRSLDSNDRRLVKLKITKTTKVQLERVVKIRNQKINMLLDALSEKELADFKRILGVIARKIRGENGN